MAEVRAAEARANRGAPPPPPDRKVVDFWEGPVPEGKARGRLTRIDCVRRGAMRVIVEGPDGKTARLVIRDPAKVMVVNGPEGKFVCGAQNPVRNVLIEYFPKTDTPLGTTGEVAIIDYSGN